MPDNNQPQDNIAQNNPGNTGGGPQGTTDAGGRGTAASPAFDDETNAARGQSNQGGVPQEGAWRPSDDDPAPGGMEGTADK